jgi:hypothetical protein
MDRRHLVRAGFGCGLAALAGCLGTLSDTSDAEGETGDSADDADEDNDDVLTTDSADEPFDRIVLGDDDDDPGAITIRNDGDDERTITVQVRHDGELAHDRTDDLPAGAALEFVLSEPGIYETHLETGSARTETAVSHATDDCGATHTLISITASGTSTRTETSC